jgi:RNA polymerase sigma-70 factor (ECF subfamily)
VEELSQTLAEVVRREKGRVVGGLVRLLGNIDAAEEAFQDAVLAALSGWPTDGMPDNPAAWLTSTARNHARDAARHRRVVAEKAPLLVQEAFMAPETIESVRDDELRLIFTCCHPALTLETQVALTLKVVAGFSTDEIARAFLSPEKTVAQRIVRAKRTIEDRKLPYEVPDRRELPERLASVLAVIYLVFNEGFAAREGALMRLDLQKEALRLSHLLCDLLPNEPEAFGLFALIAFALSRAETRVDAHGEMVLLADQDRARWDRAMIKEGLMALERARRLGGRESYVLQAEIASCHVTASAAEATDWRAIVRLYEALRALDPSPVIALNHAVAISMHEGPAAGLAALAPLEAPLARYHLFHAMRADFRRRLGQDPRPDYRQALALTSNESEQHWLQKQLEAWEEVD